MGLHLGLFGRLAARLPKPIGFMAANDIRARHVLEACHTYDLRVPEEVAVIGVDNDEVLCELSTPQLSSVEQDAKRIGYEAIALLDRMMRGEKQKQQRFLIDPLGVVTRRSTDILAVEDRLVARTMTFIQSSALEVSQFAMWLNRSRFRDRAWKPGSRRAMGYTVHAAIRRAQLQRARRMIIETNVSMKEIAAGTGFKSVQQMTTLFGKGIRTDAGKIPENDN